MKGRFRKGKKAWNKFQQYLDACLEANQDPTKDFKAVKPVPAKQEKLAHRYANLILSE